MNYMLIVQFSQKLIFSSFTTLLLIKFFIKEYVHLFLTESLTIEACKMSLINY